MGLLALVACAPLQAMASSYDLVLTGMIATPVLVFGVGMMALLLFLRGRVPAWLRVLATVLATALLVAGLWVFQLDTWPHWPTYRDADRVARGISVLVFCALWLGLLVQTCLLWSRTRRRWPTR
jgi:hypothetical protein